MSRLLDQKPPGGTWPFDYRNSAETDIAATFRRVAGPNWNKRPADVPKSGEVISKIGGSRRK